MSEHSHQQKNDNNTELFNAFKVLEAEVFKTGAVRYITGLDPNAPMPSIFNDDIKKATLGDSISVSTGVDTPVISNFIATAGVKDIDVSAEQQPFSQYHYGDQQHRGNHGIG